ncbi:Fc.00g029680.m01.CDS01 [Cosmosporella sp. VM-42]
MSKSSRQPPRQPKSQALDGLIMGTNSSSIVSKRSVERFYYPDEPHFFRYFVTKFQRRAPLINRGYWLRLKAIDVVVRQFLTSTPPGKKVVVINLGCGSDVLPWQCHTRYASACENVVFVDVDYPDLMRKKRAIVLGTPALRELLGSDPVIAEKDTDPLLLRSDKYCQLGCDLRKLDALRQALESFLPLSDCSVLFVAEVSITYMDTVSTDSLIQWASSIGQAEFCLLEQIIPNGPNHPFAKTMLSHFDKLNTTLKSVHEYPNVASQRVRFQERGWPHIEIWDLWEAWNSDQFLTPLERIALDEVEPFDEWEEFVLFARHYFIMHAKASQDKLQPAGDREPTYSLGLCFDVDVTRQDSLTAPKRRYGASMMVSDPEGQIYTVHALGLGTNGRLGSCDIYAINGLGHPLSMPPTGPSPRMCHALTDLGNHGVLLAGGRASPMSVFSDCWIFRKDTYSWQKTFDLPSPLFRHTSVRLPGTSIALVLGGRVGPSRISPDYFIFHPIKGWLKCATSGSIPEPVFGAVALNSTNSKGNAGVFGGLLSGGMTQDGTISNNAYRWELNFAGSQPLIHFNQISEVENPSLLAVFGAQTAEIGQVTAVCGGVGQHPHSQGQDITFVTLTDDEYVTTHTSPFTNNIDKWPFMIGSSVLSSGMKLFVFGGGATCFSMGTFWETGIYVAEIPSIVNNFLPSKPRTSPESVTIDFLESPQITHPGSDAVEPTSRAATKATMTTIPRVGLKSEGDFQEILRNRKPVILEGLGLGDCLEKWTPDYMAKRLGKTKQVIVHECQIDTDKMDFNSKNFRYVTDTFGAFMDRAQRGGRLYLRSLSEQKPSEVPANIDKDFPLLATDFVLPPELRLVKEQLFSSVLRISGRVNMWLHYDVMANVYTQIRGSKRMILFPPTDVSHLAFAPGASSSSLDVFSALETSRLAATHPYEAMLNPGDALFLPAMWFHTATPTTDMSVAVNVFFRDLDSGYSAGRDVYGNRDLAAYEKGRQDVSRIGKGFNRLPAEIRRFYLARLADELLHDEQG